MSLLSRPSPSPSYNKPYGQYLLLYICHCVSCSLWSVRTTLHLPLCVLFLMVSTYSSTFATVCPVPYGQYLLLYICHCVSCSLWSVLTTLHLPLCVLLLMVGTYYSTFATVCPAPYRQYLLLYICHCVSCSLSSTTKSGECNSKRPMQRGINPRESV